MILSFLKLILATGGVFLLGTIVFDLFHYGFHLGLRSKFPLLRKIGSFHLAHHQFFTPSLEIKPDLANKNFRHHLITEYLISISAMLACLSFAPILAVGLAVSLQTLIFAVVCSQRGVDPHHKPFTHLKPSRGGIFVSAEYHALHHVYPTRFYSSYCKLLDYVLGTGHHLDGKHIAMTGASGALGSQMKILLEKAGAKVITFKFGEDYDYNNYENLKLPLAHTDILFLCHGSKHDQAQAANCDSFIQIIEAFKSARKHTLHPPEVWAVGSEIEFHPCFGIKKLYPYANSKRNFARKARAYFQARDIQYRHLVHSAFMSRMGPGLMSARFAAKMTLFLIKRDFRYVPVSYMGFAYLNYFRYAFNK
jgi:hypothetical protein